MATWGHFWYLLTVTSRRTVELFHLIFVRALFAGLGDKTLLAVKGGINLRFFFESVRFSEDLDLDVGKMAKGTLENRVDRLLDGVALVGPLRTRGITIAEVTKPKQTETVQKWKVGLVSSAGSVPERTKIEFSRRTTHEESRLEAVSSEIANHYAIPAYLASHYPCAAAVRQKIHALAGRAVTQPRDVFDLNVLLARPDAPKRLDDEAKGWIPRAIENAVALTYDQYVALVIAFLEPEHAELYASREAWEAMLVEVIERLECLK